MAAIGDSYYTTCRKNCERVYNSLSTDQKLYLTRAFEVVSEQASMATYPELLLVFYSPLRKIKKLEDITHAQVVIALLALIASKDPTFRGRINTDSTTSLVQEMLKATASGIKAVMHLKEAEGVLKVQIIENTVGITVRLSLLDLIRKLIRISSDRADSALHLYILETSLPSYVDFVQKRGAKKKALIELLLNGVTSPKAWAFCLKWVRPTFPKNGLGFWKTVVLAEGEIERFKKRYLRHEDKEVALVASRIYNLYRCEEAFFAFYDATLALYDLLGDDFKMFIFSAKDFLQRLKFEAFLTWFDFLLKGIPLQKEYRLAQGQERYFSELLDLTKRNLLPFEETLNVAYALFYAEWEEQVKAKNGHGVGRLLKPFSYGGLIQQDPIRDIHTPQAFAWLKFVGKKEKKEPDESKERSEESRFEANLKRVSRYLPQEILSALTKPEQPSPLVRLLENRVRLQFDQRILEWSKEDKENEQAFRHAFSPLVDLLVGTHFSHRTTWKNTTTGYDDTLYLIPVKMEWREQTFLAVIEYCIGEDGVCYHRYISFKREGEIFGFLDEVDFPSLKEAAKLPKKGKIEKEAFGEEGEILLDLDGIATIVTKECTFTTLKGNFAL